MRLVVGLGNPGPEYDGTRHNIGFEVIDALARAHRFDPSRMWKNAEVCRGLIKGEDTLLVKPMTYMNLSGEPVGNIVRYYKAEPTEVVVIHDELDFNPGEVRLKANGGHGGHNGLRSLISHVGKDFLRIRMGVGKPPSASQGANYVLTRFDRGSRSQMDDAVIIAMQAVECILSDGMQAAMNRFNRKP
jgi:PTH1 family peptidyl-tRNA hydrolase